jgi:hypothetical protein
MKHIYSLLIGVIAVIAALAMPQVAQAKTAATSAALTPSADLTVRADDKRAQILRDYLESRNSPLAPYAQTFIEEADKNNLDWRLVASIAGLESSFGVHIPAYSYNGWGYGVYGNNVRRFASWDEGIAVVSKALRDDYMTKWGAQSIPEIGRIYAASPTWAVRVEYFMTDIDEFSKRKPTTLAISL